jgi:ABC-type antimicrobial peptide transport system permease subunit
MLRFALHLTLRTGREALTRLLVTMAAVAVGVSLLLCVLATYHAYQATIGRPCWECTHQQATPASTATLLWSYREDYYQGKKIERLDVASLAATTPVLVGIPRMPASGQFYASPALAALLKAVPADQLGDRFPGILAGTMGTAGLTSPDELAVVVGHTASDLATRPDTLRVSHINTAPRQFSTSQFYRFGFAMGAVALLIPMLVLIGTATRLAAARREERYAALRLVGATQRQVSVIASVDAMLAGLFGALLGMAAYAALHPVLADVSLIGTRFFTADITPTSGGYLAVLFGVPLAAAGASVLSLYRVGISPLGVSRRVTPAPPRAWRLIMLAIGLPLFCLPLLLDANSERRNLVLPVLSLALVILGLMVAGPWLTMQAARLLARYAHSGPAVLAARRLADNPRAAYRSVSGLVLAVMVGTALAAIVPAAIAAQQTTEDNQLGTVLRAGFAAAPACAGPCRQLPAPSQGGLPPASATALITDLTAVPGVHVMPIYFDHGANLISCADLRQVTVLGTCSPGVRSVLADTSGLFTDSLATLNKLLPFVSANTPSISEDPAGLSLSTILVTVDSPATLERARTLLSRYSTPTDEANQAPQTFGEVAQARAALYLEVQRAVIIIAGLTLLIAGCSLTVAVSGGIIERKRPFTLLRLAGTPVRALYRVVLLETLFPLIAAIVVAAAVGFAVALPVARALAPDSHATPLPGGAYYLTLGSGLLLAIAVILACLPILNRITITDNACFE